MASVKALAVSGVRSFGCEDGDSQRVSFWKPLTVIVGENGCGKTTLLEALKFALCDELPPNADHGRNFVRDPALDLTSDSRAQIRLEFSDSKGKKYLVIRTMQAQIKQKKMQFQRLDNIIQTTDDRGNVVEISGRCGDTNNTISSILGVSKAILNNVIFCHQEDSNWPLDEGKKLKERFDAIFDTTKYNKCFEYVKKLRKDYATKIKLLDQDVNFCLERKQEYDGKNLKLLGFKKKIEEVNEELVELQAKLKPFQKRLSEIEIIENNIVKFKSKLEISKSGLTNCLKQQDDLRSNIKKVYDGTEENLRDEIESFSANVSKKEQYLNDYINNQKKLTDIQTNVEKKISTNKIKMSELSTLEKQNEEKVLMKHKHLLDVAKFADINIPHSSENDSSTLLELIQNEMLSSKNELNAKTLEANVEEETLQKNIDKCRDSFTRHKETISNKEKECLNLKKQIKTLESDISDANTSKSNLEHLKKEMEISNTYFQTISEQFDISECETKINEQESEIAVLEMDIDNLDKNITLLQAQNSKQTKINVQKDTLASKQKQFTRNKNKNRDYMTEVIGNNIPESNFKKIFQDCHNKLKNEVEELEKIIKEKQRRLTSLEEGRKHKKNELDVKKNDLVKGEEELYKHCKKQNLEDVLTKVDTDINKFQDQKSELASSEFVIKKFVDKLNDPDPCCPLCHRGFDSQNDVTELVTELQDKISNVPKNLELVIDKLSKLMFDRDQLVSLRPKNANIKELKNEVIPVLEQNLEKIDNEIQDIRDAIDEYSISLMEPKGKLDTVEKFLSDMPLLDQLNQEMSSIKLEINKLENELNLSDINMTLNEANVKQSELKREISSLKASIKSNQKNLKDHNVKLNSARDKKNLIKERYLLAQTKVQELCSLQSKYEELTETRSRLESELNSLSELSNNLLNDLKSAEEKKKKSIEVLRKNIDNKRKYINELDKKLNTILGFDKEINSFNAKDIPGQLVNIKKIIEELNSEREDIVIKIKLEVEKINETKDELLNQKVIKRELDDNLRLKMHEKEEQNFINDISKLQEKMGELNHKGLFEEKEKILSSQNSIVIRKANIAGEIKQLQESVKHTELELKQSHFRDVNEKYRKKFYELQILKVADKDIKDYAFAMDYSLMKYHKEKMKKINSTIRELWQNIYRGNDIDFIEIKTDENTSSAASGNRRVYDYRVVQHRNNAEIDMRGRCSAGQKVLASLIIRMALAETFSNKFGVLALDEPTTNLDKENIVSMCCALKEMVATRKHNNFIFIIITHDAEFLNSLGSIDKLTHYYRVSRNREGKSAITKERIP